MFPLQYQMLQLKTLYCQVKGGVYLHLKKFIALGFAFHCLPTDSPTGGESMLVNVFEINITSRIAKKLNYKRPFLKIALPSMFFLADQAMDVYYHQLPMDDVVALILFSSFFIIFLYGCFNTIQLRRMVSLSFI